MEKTYKKILANYQKNNGNIITILQDIQNTFGYIPEDVVCWFSKKLEIPASNFFRIATFYAQFSLKPRGKNHIQVCMGTACYVKRSDDILKEIDDALGIDVGDITTDKKFSLESIRCLGACGLAPVMVIGHEIYGNVKPKRVKEILKYY